MKAVQYSITSTVGRGGRGDGDKTSERGEWGRAVEPTPACQWRRAISRRARVVLVIWRARLGADDYRGTTAGPGGRDGSPGGTDRISGGARRDGAGWGEGGRGRITMTTPVVCTWMYWLDHYCRLCGCIAAVCVRACVRAYLRACASCVRVHVCTHVRTHARVCMHVCIRLHARVCAWTCVLARVHAFKQYAYLKTSHVPWVSSIL